MIRIAQIDPDAATGLTKQLFESVQGKLGVIPNLFRVLGNAPAALNGYLSLSSALADGGFDAQLREQIALVVAEINQCSYCLSAHTFIGKKLGLTDQNTADARHAFSTNERTAAILKLARCMVLQRAELSDSSLEEARTAGLTNADIIETVANVVVNIFSNYVNHIAGTIVDFPEVKPGSASAPSCERAYV